MYVGIKVKEVNRKKVKAEIRNVKRARVWESLINWLILSSREWENARERISLKVTSGNADSERIGESVAFSNCITFGTSRNAHPRASLIQVVDTLKFSLQKTIRARKVIFILLPFCKWCTERERKCHISSAFSKPSRIWSLLAARNWVRYKCEQK